MTPTELKDKVENEDLTRDQLFDIAQKLGLKVDKKKGTAMLRSMILDKADELEAAFPDGDVYQDELPADPGTPRKVPEDTSPQAADLERRKDPEQAETSGVEAPKQTGTFTPNIEAQAAEKSLAETEDEGYQKPSGRVLINTTNGRRFPWSAALANRKDMKEL